MRLDSINKKHLIYIYAIAPFFLAFVLIDHFLFSQHIKGLLPNSPFTLFATLLIFQFPHVIGSQISFLEKEYLTRYKYKFTIGLIVISLFVLLIPPHLNYFLLAALLIMEAFHAAGQQFGLTSLFTKLPNIYSFKAWRILGAFIFLCVSLLTYQIYILPSLYLNIEKQNLITIASVAVMCFISLGWQLAKNSSNLGRLYIFANISMVVCSMICFFMQYYFFTILITKLIHDTTSYLFYLNHDSNRLKVSSKNLVYKYLKPNALPLFITFFLVSFLIAMPLTYFQHKIIILKATPIILAFHYYVESFLWRSGSLHRSYIVLN